MDKIDDSLNYINDTIMILDKNQENPKTWNFIANFYKLKTLVEKTLINEPPTDSVG